ncbi:MAG: DUF452 family protein [Bacteroidales bacterium]|nr:DUF452 family protein [Bacteroidales bacterium]
MQTPHNLIFLGWGMDLNSIPPILRMTDSTYFYNYAEVIPFSPDPNAIYNVYAWSFGVYVAPILINQWGISSQIVSATAINGTCLPVDDTFGIPVSIAQGTLDNLSEASRQKFNIRMFSSRSEYTENQQYSSQRDIEDLRKELSFFITHALSANKKITMNKGLALYQPMGSEHNLYTLAVIGTQDRIFPPQNQLAFWQSQGIEVRQLEMGHWPTKI